MKKAAIYMRVSTKNQEDEETIENQRMELLARVKKDGHLLLDEHIYMDEGWSGIILERPGLDKMRTDAKDKLFNVLYTYDRGRVSRKFIYQEIVINELRALDIEYISLHDINGTSSEEVLMGSVMGIFHEYERLKITERMRIGKVRKVQQNGKLLGYQPKFGYDFHPRTKDSGATINGYFTVNEAQAEVVKMIFSLSASGLSKYAIQKELAKHKILPPKAKRLMWSTSSIDRLLRDSTYYGEHYYNKSESVETKNPRNPEVKYRRVAKGSRRKRPMEEWMKIEVPAIIAKDLYNEAQEQLARNKRFSTRNNNKNHYLLTGLIECVCGYTRAGEGIKSGHLYYRCNERRCQLSEDRACKEKGINAAVLDSLIWKNVHELLTQPELLIQQAERWQKKGSPLIEQVEGLQRQIKELDDTEDRYAKMYGKAMMSEDIYSKNINQLRQARTQLMREVTTTEHQLSQEPSVPLEQLLESVVKLVEELDFADKKQIIRKLVTKVVATKEEVTVWGRIPLLSTGQVGLNGSNWNRRPTKRRQINPIQRPNE